jgi:HD-like signal output (HDOD) protein
VLVEALRRALMLRDLVAQPKMRALLGHLGPLPPAPIVYTELTRRLEDPSVSVSELALLIAEDASLAAQVLRIANSAYFGRDKAVTRIVDAAARVGTRLLRGLVLTAELYGRFPTTRAVADQIEEVQRHSALVARIASGLEPRAAWREDAFTGGLLHDIGKVVLLSRMPDTALAIVHEAVESGRDEFHVEMERLGTHHGTLGACLLGMWGLPSMLLECVHGHHDLSLDIPHTLNAVRAVALADRLAHDVTDSEEAQLRREPLPVAILTDPRWSWWREMADQIAHEGSAV